MKKTPKFVRFIWKLSALPIGISLGLIVYISHPQITIESSIAAPIPMVLTLALAYLANCVLMSSHQVIPKEGYWESIGIMSLLLCYVFAGFLLFIIRAHYSLNYTVTFVLVTSLWTIWEQRIQQQNAKENVYALVTIGNWTLVKDTSVQTKLVNDPSQLSDLRYDRLVIDYNSPLSDDWKKELARLVVVGNPAIHVSDLIGAVSGRVPLQHVSDDHLKSSLSRNAYLAIKRLMDLAMATVGLIILSPIVLVLAAIIKISSPGPALFAQTRVGKNGRMFTLYKLRTMEVDAEESGPVFATLDDSRITRVGRYLRKLRIDEWPQFWNVLIGNMSIVGPRPERPEWVNSYKTNIPYYELRHLVRPGITGWAQINQGYASGEKESETKLEYDLYYIKWMGFTIDVLVILRTLFVLGKGFGAK